VLALPKVEPLWDERSCVELLCEELPRLLEDCEELGSVVEDC
jgi:hypothetical protein